MDNETWKDIKDYKGLYQISNLGKIKKLEKRLISYYKDGRIYKGYKKEKILKNRLYNNGYYGVVLSKNNKQKNIFIHRILAIYFIPNPENKLEVNHKDGNKQNNDINNLEWVTKSENQKHAFKIGLKKVSIKNNYMLAQKPVYCKELNKTFKSISEASRILNLHISSISEIARKIGYRKTTGGYSFEYIIGGK